MVMMEDSEVNWAAMPLSGVFETRTGPLVLVGAFKANPLRDICTALGIDDLSLDARYATLSAQFENKAIPASTGLRSWKSRTCSRPRCATCARRWSIRRRCTTQ